MGKNKIILILAICALAVVGVALGSGILKGQASQDTKPNDQPTGSLAQYHKITAPEAQEMMSKSKGFILLDVRTEEEFAEKRIDGAMLIPDYEIEKSAAAKLPDKDMTIFVYCRSGRRSANAANALVNMGYTNVYDFGGINDWPYDTVSD